MYRPSFLAGRWYPGNESDCRAAIEGHAVDTRSEQEGSCALIGPHAGWSFSGDAAGRSYRILAESTRQSPDLVVVFGSHLGRQGSKIFLDEGWETPLGRFENARDLAAGLHTDMELAEEQSQPTNPDNAVEVHLPFAKYFFPQAELLVIGVEASERASTIGVSARWW